MFRSWWCCQGVTSLLESNCGFSGARGYLA
jgi:hypothetical protein